MNHWRLVWALAMGVVTLPAYAYYLWQQRDGANSVVRTSCAALAAMFSATIAQGMGWVFPAVTALAANSVNANEPVPQGVEPGC